MPATRVITKPFVAVTAVTATFFLYVGMLVPILPRFIEDELDGGEIGVGASVAVFALTAVVARPVIARVIERVGRRPVIQVGAAIAGVAGIATALVDGLVPLLVLRGIAGIGEAAIFVAAATLVADLAPPHRRAEAASYFSVAVFGGLGVGPIIGELVVAEDRFHLAFAVAGGAALAAALAAFVIPTSTPAVPVATTDAAATDASDLAAVGEVPPGPSPRALIHPAALGPGLVLASGISAFAVFSAFVPDHARDVGLGGSGGLFALYSVVCLALRLGGARLPERLGARTSVTIALCSTATSVGLLAAVPQVWALWLAAGLIGVGQAFAYPSLMALTIDRVSERERPLALGSFTMFFDLGSIVGGLALGLVAEQFTKRSAFAGAVVLALAGLWLLWTRVAVEREPGRDTPPARLLAVLSPAAGD
ncbi:MAG: MFS transporter [Desertimonas sp.]